MTFDLARIGEGLPVAATISQLPQLLERTGALVVEAPPGTGKTTLIPPAVFNHTRHKVLVVAPRRVAVRAAYRRLVQLSQRPDLVGYTIRGESRRGSAIEFLTPGVMLRRLLSDPGLEGISAVIVDEVHERQLDTDLAVGMLAEVQQLRDDFRLVVMSATLDAERYSLLLGGAAILSTPAVTYPLNIDYAPHPGRAQRSHEFYEHLAKLAVQATEQLQQSALVFVPGVREVEQVVAATGGIPLHGRLSSAEQDAALTRTEQSRIVVATSVAESSLTVPGVRVVIDSGLSRVPRRDARGMNGLVTVSEARSTADQRAGRAGREGPGTVIRAFSEGDYQRFAAHITPEIRTSDLTEAALQLACWATPRGEGLPLLDPPPPAALTAAEETLHELAAIDSTGHATAHGRALARLPVDPRHGSALLRFGSQAAATVAAMADSPRGNLATARPERSQVARLSSLVDDCGTHPAGVIIAAAYPSQVARHLKEEVFLLASGTRARCPEATGHEWIAVAEIQLAGSQAFIRAWAPITETDALDAIGVSTQLKAELIDGRIRGRLLRCAGAIELSSTPAQIPPEQAAAALEGRVSLSDFTFSPAAQSLYERLLFLERNVGKPWPDPHTLDLAPEIAQVAAGKAIQAVDIYPALQRLLPWPEAARLDELAPERLQVPSGSRPRIGYADGRPTVRVKLQECFGLAETPSYAGVPVLFHLLSPAGRPLAVTDDLASFWSGPYQEVRKEMRGRYPKHPWPEDPWTASATAKPKRQSRR